MKIRPVEAELLQEGGQTNCQAWHS